MKIAIGAPVGDDRERILDHYFDAIRSQTVQPDAFCFTLAWSASQDLRTTLKSRAQTIAPTRIAESGVPFYPRSERQGDPGDSNRAAHFSKLRNELRALFLQTDADIFFSLDTDVLLEDPTTIERLSSTIFGERAENPTKPYGYDLASPLLFLHPNGAPYAPNGGWWTAGLPGDPQRVWRRADENDLATLRSPARIDCPMAAVMMRRHVLARCKYKPHEAGEDLGFADALNQRGFRTAWLTDCRARHIWSERYLSEAVAP